MPALFGEKKAKVVKAEPSPSVGLIKASSATLLIQPSRGNVNELEPDELKTITRGCLEYLRAPPRGKHAEYVQYLVTATFCLGMAPRQQVLRQLQLGSSFIKKDNGQFWILTLASMNKNGKATSFPLPRELGQAYNFYLDTVRPRMMGSKIHDFLFCMCSGDPPSEMFDFSDWTNKVSMVLIGKAVNTHAFRRGVVKTYYQTGVTQVEMNGLAEVMGHDPATARGTQNSAKLEAHILCVSSPIRASLGFSQLVCVFFICRLLLQRRCRKASARHSRTYARSV